MKLRRNAVWNVAEALATSLALFLVYRAILAELGVSAMGIWALVVSATAVGRVGDLGVSGGLTRFVAIRQAVNGDPPLKSTPAKPEAIVYVETALLMNAGLYTVLAGLIYWPAWWALGWATEGADTSAARDLLAYAVAAFALQSVSSVVMSALVGAHRSDIKSMIMLASYCIQATVALVYIERLGLAGLAVAQIVQYVGITIAGWVAISIVLSGTWKGQLPRRFDLTALRELFGFGLRLQALTLSTFMFEPAVKFVLSSTLGVGVLGLYELASRVTMQVRALVLAPSQNLTPLLATKLQSRDADLTSIYRRSVLLLSAAALVAMGGLALGSPLVSIIWFGRIDWLFVTLSALVAAGWLVNMYAVPGYYLGIASGRLKWNIAGGLLTMLFSPAAAWGLAQLLGPTGAVAGIALGVAGGALLTAIFNERLLTRHPACVAT